jgi:hypothetical protein
MKAATVMPFRTVLPLPAFVLHPLTAVVVAAVHVYLAFGHLSQLLGGDIQWTHIWKGFGALGGACVFAALASRALARREGGPDGHQHEQRLEGDLSNFLPSQGKAIKSCTLQEELAAFVNEQTNRRLFVLTLVTVLGVGQTAFDIAP